MSLIVLYMKKEDESCMAYTCKTREPDAGWQKPVLDALPDNIKAMILGIPDSITRYMEEIRIRENRPLMIHSHGRDYFLCADGEVTSQITKAYIVTRADTKRVLGLISDYSIYAFEEELRNGYITLKGGHRVGLVGTTVLENGRVKTMKYVNSFNIRISREIKGVSNKALPFITKGNDVCHTLVISSPQMGKTTLLRDIARNLSNGFKSLKGKRVGIVDERSEIAGCYEGIPQKDVGCRTDILDACPKAEGIIMMIRSMSPDVIITDEIGRPEDASAIEDAMNAGIKIITSAHGSCLNEALARPFMSSLLSKRIFERILVLGNSLGVGTLEAVYSGDNYQVLLDIPVR
jgi:stage III sporulation protein AA